MPSNQTHAYTLARPGSSDTGYSKTAKWNENGLDEGYAEAYIAHSSNAASLASTAKIPAYASIEAVSIECVTAATASGTAPVNLIIGGDAITELWHEIDFADIDAAGDWAMAVGSGSIQGTGSAGGTATAVALPKMYATDSTVTLYIANDSSANADELFTAGAWIVRVYYKRMARFASS